jgi:hypothetical protein
MKKFIHCNFSSTFSFINIIHPWTRDKIFYRITKYFVLSAKKYFKNILSMWENIFKMIRSCSLPHAHIHAWQLANTCMWQCAMCTQKLGNMHVTMCNVHLKTCQCACDNVKFVMCQLENLGKSTCQNKRAFGIPY